MATIIELKYFNSFWLKKIEDITKVVPGSNTLEFRGSVGKRITLEGPGGYNDTEMNVGQQVTINWTVGPDNFTYVSYVVEILSPTQFVVAKTVPTGIPVTGVIVSFGKIINFDNIPQAYDGNDAADWLIEESRIRGGYNNTQVDLGVKAYAVEDEPRQSHRFSSLIHSGIFNSRTGVNQTNQFSVAEDITRTIDPANGSIQKLYAEDTNLIIFQESKVSKSLIDKDAIYSAEGNASVTSRNLVIGQNVAYGGWDAHNKQYVLSIPQSEFIAGPENYKTVAFDETSKGWVSLFDYKPNQIFSLNNNYFTTNLGKIYKHYTLAPNTQARAVFYGTQNESSVTFVFNGAPSVVKNFQTINYEGDTGWRMTTFKTNTDSALAISQATFATTLEQMQNSLLANNFKLKEDKYYADISNITSAQSGEVVFGRSSSGVKGFFGEVTMTIDNSAGKKELFAVSTGFVKSS